MNKKVLLLMRVCVLKFFLFIHFSMIRLYFVFSSNEIFNSRRLFPTFVYYIQWNWWLHLAAMLCYYPTHYIKCQNGKKNIHTQNSPYELWIRIRNIMISSCEHSHLSTSRFCFSLSFGWFSSSLSRWYTFFSSSSFDPFNSLNKEQKFYAWRQIVVWILKTRWQ